MKQIELKLDTVFFLKRSKCVVVVFVQVSHLFNSSLPPPVVDWEGLYLKADTLVGLVTELATKGPPHFLERLAQHWTGSQDNLLQIYRRLKQGDPQL